MYRMNVTQKGQLVIPKELRDKYGIEPDGEVLVTEIDNHIAVLPALGDPIKEGRGMLKLARPAAQIIREIRAEERRLEGKRLARLFGGKHGQRRRK